MNPESAAIVASSLSWEQALSGFVLTGASTSASLGDAHRS
jgi:hypothetical protein